MDEAGGSGSDIGDTTGDEVVGTTPGMVLEVAQAEEEVAGDMSVAQVTWVDAGADADADV